MANHAALDAQLNEMILQGKAMEAFDKFYADDVTMQENSDPPTLGKAANHEREMQFFGMVEHFYGAQLLAQAFAHDVGFAETATDLQFKGMPRMTMSQVAVRRWKDGKVVSERFYYNKG